jgi:hypothetical protein
MKSYGGVDVEIHVFLISAPVGGEWSASHPGRFTPGERAPGTNWIGGQVVPRTGLDDVEKRKCLTLPGFELRPLYLLKFIDFINLRNWKIARCIPSSHYKHARSCTTKLIHILRVYAVPSI